MPEGASSETATSSMRPAGFEPRPLSSDLQPIQASLPHLRDLARRYRVALGDAGAADVDADELGVLTLPGDAVAEAERVTNLVGALA